MRFLKALAVTAALLGSSTAVQAASVIRELRDTYSGILPATDTRPLTLLYFTISQDFEGLGGMVRGTCKQVRVGPCASWSVEVLPARPTKVTINGEDFFVTSPEFKHIRSWVVRVGNVPEPATWAMLILGFGMIGAALRTRRHHIAATV